MLSNIAIRLATQSASSIATAYLGHLTNTMNKPSNTVVAAPFGFGAQRNAMDSTDMAYSDTPYGTNNNPTGIARVHHSEIQFALEPHILMGTRYKDSSGNDKRSESGNHPKVRAGTQDGASFQHVDLLAGTENRDDITIPFDIFCAAPPTTYNVNNQLRPTVSTSYAEAGPELFAKTHLPRSTQAAQIDKIYAENNAGGEGNFSKSIATICQSNKASPTTCPINNLGAKWYVHLGYRHNFSTNWTGPFPILTCREFAYSKDSDSLHAQL